MELILCTLLILLGVFAYALIVSLIGMFLTLTTNPDDTQNPSATPLHTDTHKLTRNT